MYIRSYVHICTYVHMYTYVCMYAYTCVLCFVSFCPFLLLPSLPHLTPPTSSYPTHLLLPCPSPLTPPTLSYLTNLPRTYPTPYPSHQPRLSPPCPSSAEDRSLLSSPPPAGAALPRLPAADTASPHAVAPPHAPTLPPRSGGPCPHSSASSWHQQH